MLHKALTERRPPIVVTHGTVKEWVKKYKVAGDAEPLKSAQDFEDKYGDSIRHLAVEYPTAYKLYLYLNPALPGFTFTFTRLS